MITALFTQLPAGWAGFPDSSGCEDTDTVGQRRLHKRRLQTGID
jgi:hypothetical protein